jgi:hypothetical protein
MATIIFVIGNTGSGKTSAMRTLDPERTLIINVLDKDLPWRGSRLNYTKKKRNIRHVDSQEKIIATIKERIEFVDTIVFDDIGYTMTEEFFNKMNVTGYEKYNQIGGNMQKIIKFAKNIEDNDKTFIFVFHADVNDGNKELKIKTIGKLLDDKYELLGITPIALFTKVSIDGKDEAKYTFITNRSIDNNGVTIPAKSPMGMFPSKEIPNDMAYVMECVHAYYNGDDVPQFEKENSEEKENSSSNA